VSSASNTVTGVLSGVTLNLLSASPGSPIALNVSANTASATQAVNSFVSAYNSLITSINQQFTYDPASAPPVFFPVTVTYEVCKPSSSATQRFPSLETMASRGWRRLE